jgi:uncharacterized protein YndB with AHSA1/START domain
MSDTRNIDLTYTIAADTKAVWAALTEADKLMRWFAPDVRVNPGSDGSIFVSWGPGMEGESKIRLWEPNKHLRFEFGENPQTKQPISVDYFLEGKGGETVLRLVHSGFSADAEWDEEFDSHMRGWRIFMHTVRYDLEHQAGKPCKQHVISVDTALDRGQAWARVFGPKGLDRDKGLAGKSTGDEIAIVTATGDPITGTVQVLANERDLGITFAELGNGLLRLSFERRSKGGTMVYGVIVQYGTGGNAEAITGRLREVIQSALAG